jgi:protease I
MKALILAADGFEDLQLFYPWLRLREEGFDVTVAAPGPQPLTGLHGHIFEPDMPIRELNPAEYDLLLLPGGYAPEKLRLREEAVDVARTFMEEDRRVAALCRGPQLLISAGALNARALTCNPAIRDDVRAAGALYRDEAVVHDGNLLTARGSGDLPEFFQQLFLALGARVDSRSL